MATFREPDPHKDEREIIDLRNDHDHGDEAAVPTRAEPAERWLADGPLTGSQARGAVMFGAVGAVFGVGIGAIIAVIPISDWTYIARFVLFASVCALAGSVAGAVYGGGREPEIEGDVARDVEHPRTDTASPGEILRPAHIDEDMAHRTEEARHRPRPR